jgi:D-lactate dehydrogenase
MMGVHDRRHFMKIAVFSAQRYDQEFLAAANASAGHRLRFFDAPLDLDSVAVAAGHEAVCIFVNDKADAAVLEALAAGGTRLVALRCTGFNNVDLRAAGRLGLRVVRVVSYSPYSVAEHAVALLQAINRKVHRAYNRTRDSNFSLDGLMGFDLHGKTVGVIGTGKIGRVFARIMLGFGCEVIGYDTFPSDEFLALGARYAELGEIGERAHVVSLHCPLTPDTHHIIDADILAQARRGALLINTSRGGLVNTEAVIEALKSGQLGGLAIDVYEQEADLFFRDLSDTIITDDVFQRLLSFPNVIVTGHQAFFTREAISTICETTINSVTQFANGRPLTDEIKAELGPG